MNHQKTIDSLIAWIQSVAPPKNGLLVPISGGSDSALCFWLCAQASTRVTKAIYLGDNLRAQPWFESVGTILVQPFDAEGKNPEIQRWAQFLSVSLAENRVLVGSRNKTEHALGTFSNASRVASLLPLAGLWKSDVMELCAYVGIPDSIIASSKRADPECGRPQSMADIPFEVVDDYLQVKIGDKQGSNSIGTPDQITYLDTVLTANSYKKDLPLLGPVY